MKTKLETTFATLVCLAAGFSAANPPPARAASESAPQTAPAPGREAVVLHEWSGVVPLGFNAQGRLLTFDSGRRVFEMHDLGATNAAVTGWNPGADDGKVFGGALSADRQVLATVAEVGKKQSRIQLWNAETGERSGPTFAPSDVAHVAFSPDGKRLAGVVALNGMVRVWDAASGELRWSQPLPEPMQTTWTGIQFSPDGRHLAARQSFGFSIWDVGGRQVVPVGKRVFYLAISPDWKLAHGFELKAAAGGAPRTTLMDLADPGRPIPAKQSLPKELEDALENFAFSPDGRSLALGMRDQSTRFWDLADARIIRQTPVTEGRITRLLFSPDNRCLATYEVNLGRPGAILKGKVRLWDATTGQPLSAPRPHNGMFWDWWFAPDSRCLVVSVTEGHDSFGAQIWRLGASPSPALKTSPAAKPVAAPVDPGVTSHAPRGETSPATVPSLAPRIVRRTYAADLESWPVYRSQHGKAAFEDDGYAMRPGTGSWVGPDRRLDMTPLAGDFVLEVRSRVVERTPPAPFRWRSTAAALRPTGWEFPCWFGTRAR